MNLDRKFWDEHVPKDDLNAAVRVMGICGLAASLGLDVRLEWLADANEPYFAPKIEWYEALQPWERARSGGLPRAISHRGLEYKDEAHYLTAEGWPLGTRCWYFCIDCGYRLFTCAETPELATMRAIIVVDACRRWRATEPAARKNIEIYIKEPA